MPPSEPPCVLFGDDGDVVVDLDAAADDASGFVADLRGDVWRLEGELDVSAVRVAHKAVAGAIADAAVRVVDLTALARIDGAGVQLLLWCARAQEARGQSVAFVGAVDDVARALGFVGLRMEGVA